MPRSRLLVSVAVSLAVGLGAILVTVTNLAQASPTPSGQGVVCHFISTDACMEAAAGSYIAALVSHDPSQVPLAPNCQRRENGTDTGDTAAAIKASMTPPTPDQVIIDARDIRYFPDLQNSNVLAYYLLDVATTPQETVHLAERFQVERGQITQIEAIFTTNTISTSGFPLGDL